MEFIPAEKAVPVREPSTANLLIDSTDRFVGGVVGVEKAGESSANFTITLNQNIMTGYFTRLAVSEIYLDWCVDNISAGSSNNTFKVKIGATTYTATLLDGQYTVKQALDALVIQLNAVVPTGTVFSLVDSTNVPGAKSLKLLVSGTPTNFTILVTNLQTELNFQANSAGNEFPCNCPKILPITYLDFVSNSLTYNQALKDATSNNVSRNVLYRWYFANDNVPQTLDAYGYPIYQGYQRFIIRRALPFPKQIRWTPNQPIGQLQFQVYTSQGVVFPAAQYAGGEFEYAMTLLVSEV
jgi:hypothetical protein